jgi:hypothetical protein
MLKSNFATGANIVASGKLLLVERIQNQSLHSLLQL